jgi:hypothetical protein
MEGGVKRDDMGAQGTGRPGGNAAAGETLADILHWAMTGWAQQNREACAILLALAEDGSLEQHQTSGALDGIADRLLGTLRSAEGSDAD